MKELCQEAKKRLKKGDDDFLGAHGGAVWKELRYCTLCKDWHETSEIDSVKDKSKSQPSTRVGKN